MLAWIKMPSERLILPNQYNPYVKEQYVPLSVAKHILNHWTVDIFTVKHKLCEFP